MPDIKKYFAGSQVSDWTSGSFGGGGAGAFAVDPGSGNTTTTYTDSGTSYESREFTASGNFTVTGGSGVVDIFIVGGGGGGTGSAIRNFSISPGNGGIMGGGGGGSGGVQTVTGIAVSSTGGPAGNGVYPVVIGAGGTAGPAQTDTSPGNPVVTVMGGKGTASDFNDIKAYGGGGGNWRGDYVPGDPLTSPATYSPGIRENASGATGGGGNTGGYPNKQFYGAFGSSGYPGGDGNGSGGNGGGGSPTAYGGIGYYQAPGTWPTGPTAYPYVSPVIGSPVPGGGAGPANSYISVSGKGAAGVANVFKGGPGAPVTYASGGGGGLGGEPGNAPGPGGYGVYVWPATPGGGGKGGGNNRPTSPTAKPGPEIMGVPVHGGAGTANTGGGGGGGGGRSDVTPNVTPSYPDMGSGGAGGSGVVIVRWAS